MSLWKNLIAAAALGTIATAASAQTTLTQVWKVQADDPASPYLLSTGDGTRGMFLNTNTLSGGSLLVASRTGGNFVRRLDPATGALKTPATIPNTNYIATGSTFVINKVLAADDGTIYALSLGVNSAGQRFRIYRHADEFSEASVPVDIATDSSGTNARLGDDADIISSGTTTKILVAGSTNKGMYVFTTTDSGLTFTSISLTGSPAFPTTTPNIAWDPTIPNRFYYRDASVNFSGAYDISTTNTGVAYGSTGPNNSLPPGTPVNTFGAYSPFDIGMFNNVKSVVLAIGASTGGQVNKPILVDQLSDLTTNYVGMGSEFSGGAMSNGNAAGDVYLDSTNNVFYVLYTNNSVTKYGLPSEVSDWNMY